MQSNKSTYLKVKDHSVTGEEFQLLHNKDLDMLETYPRPMREKLSDYYKSENYISHTDTKRNLLELIYHSVRQIALKRKLKLINSFNTESKSLLDIGCGSGSITVEAGLQIETSGKIIAKNPVWIFGTESTNFLRIQNNIDTMVTSVNEISSIPKDNPAYYTGMLDINDRALLLKINIMDATPYMYVSPANMMLSAIWVAALIGIFIVLKRKKEQLKKVDLPNNISVKPN